MVAVTEGEDRARVDGVPAGAVERDNSADGLAGSRRQGDPVETLTGQSTISLRIRRARSASIVQSYDRARSGPTPEIWDPDLSTPRVSGIHISPGTPHHELRHQRAGAVRRALKREAGSKVNARRQRILASREASRPRPPSLPDPSFAWPEMGSGRRRIPGGRPLFGRVFRCPVQGRQLCERIGFAPLALKPLEGQRDLKVADMTTRRSGC
jgi:hypothetical protein